MKRTRGEKERWEDFEARVGIKRSGGGKKETHKAAPSDILVQRMSSTASGRLKKFEPLRLVFTSDGVVVGVVIRSVKRYDLVKIKPTESEAEH